MASKMNVLVLILALISIELNITVVAQTTFGDSLSVKAEATVQTAPDIITLSWPADNDATNFIISRKLKGATSWGPPLITLPSNATSFADLGVVPNTLYDYKIQMTSGTSPAKFGYLSAGINVTANSDRGIAIVVVESTHIADALYLDALNQFILDLELDGWYAKKIVVNAVDNVSDVKSAIQTVYNEDPTKTKLLVLLGNVPVPYSGNLNPDGHPDHQGAWPTDLYYADMDGNWTDASVSNTTSANALNHNIPGDGKFDQTYLPSDVELQVGRVDLSNLPVYTEGEKALMISYFNKAHLFKMGNIVVGEQALIDDHFTGMAEGFSQNGYNNFAALVGKTNTYTADYFTQLSYNTSTTGTYLWSYGCGGGTYTSASGIGNSTNFANDSLSSVFTMLFGSYFGDWNYTNAFLRAPLAQGNTLTNCWAGRPNWYFNHMAMGENIGYSARLTQNNASLYQPSTLGGLARMISINLMGDPSLRMNYLNPPTNLLITENGNSNNLNWTASGSEIGYNIYRRYADSTNFLKLNSVPVTSTNFTDASLPVPGIVYYYVKAVELKVTPSGSYHNESLAVRDSALSMVGLSNLETLSVQILPNPTSGPITLIFGEKFERSTVRITTITGQIVFEQDYFSADKVELNLNSESGIYLVQLITEQGNFETKIVKK